MAKMNYPQVDGRRIIQRLAHFNEPGYPEYMGGKRCIVSDSSWSPDGKKIVVLVAYEGVGFVGLQAKIVIIELE